MTKIDTILANIQSSNDKFMYSPFKEWNCAPATTKGKIGEEIAAELLKDKGCKVSARVNKEHDLIVDGKKVEVKTAFLKRNNDFFSFYGYDATEDPHYWVLQLVYPTEIVMVKMDRTTMAAIHLGKTRKNTMFDVTLDTLKDAGGEVILTHAA